MTEIKYVCCPGCHGWYQEGSTHTCDFQVQYGDRAASPSPKFVFRAVSDLDLYELINQLNRIAYFLEKLVEK